MEEEIDLKKLIELLWRKKLIIIITTLVFALFAFIKFGIIDNLENSTTTEEQFYYAQTTFIVGVSQTSTTKFEQPIEDNTVPVNITGNSKFTLTDVLVETYNRIVKSETALKNVINKLNLNISTSELSSLVSVSRVSTSDLLCLVVAYQDETQVTKIADELMKEFIEAMSKSYYIDTVSVIDSAYSLSESQLSSDILSTLSTPTSMDKASTKKELKYIVVFAMAGFILSTGYVLVLNVFDESIENINGLNIKSLITIHKNNESDNFSILRIKLAENKTILITSPECNDGKSYVVQNLATSFAKTKKKVLLLDLSSNTSNLLEKYDDKGLFDYLDSKNKTINKFISKSNVENLDVLLKGSIDKSYLDEAKLQEILSSLEEKYDYIIIDSKNVLDSANTLEISKIVKNTILVATEGKTNLNKFNEAIELIQEVHGNILGGILIEK